MAVTLAMSLNSFHPHQSGGPDEPLEGVIVEWLDDKGFGWVEAGGKRHFMHIRQVVRRLGRPKVGERVRFALGTDATGRPCAVGVRFIGAQGHVGLGTGLLLAPLLFLPSLALLWLPFEWWQCALVWLLICAVTFAWYAHDKSQAINHRWRTSESLLHLLELLGGWPGALIAQRYFRHKCSKLSYQLIFWCIVFMHQVAALDLMLAHRICRSLMQFIEYLSSTLRS